jgi:putative endopeptidase
MLAALVCASCLAALATTAPVFPPWGVTLDYLDPATDPGADFFRYTNGRWLKSAVIPPDRSYAGVDLEVNQGNEAKLRAIIAGLVAKPDADLTAEERKLRDLYNTFEDTRTIDAAGIAPLKETLARIAALATAADVAAFMGVPGSFGDTRGRALFDRSIEPDEKNPDTYVLHLGHAGLGLPDRDYYLRDDKELAATREAYRKYLTDMLAFAGITDPARSAAVYALESRIAGAHWPAEERREEDKIYNPMTLTELEHFAPQFPWNAYLTAAGITREGPHGERVVIVAEKSSFPKLAEIFASTPVPVWRDFLVVHYLHAYAPYLARPIDDRDFAFYGIVIRGKKQQLPRDLRGIHLLDEQMGEALGKLYCARYFPPEAKARSRELVDNLLKAYEIDIRSLDWMTPATRQKALEKVRAFTVKIGYPDQWRDYSALAITAGDLLGDVRNAEAFEWNRRLARIDRPVDRGEWDMTPPTNNAYYNPTLNEIVFPAGILQPPYFDPQADDAVNYGEIGATIGHEISHGFDDQGSKYDAQGRLNNWWTDQDRKDFDARTTRLAQQYDQYEPLPGLHVNGKLTLGENIAGLAGLVIARKAYHIALGGRPAPVLNGFTGDQRFYIAYGQSWRAVWSDGLTRESVLSDPHSPMAFRVNGVVRNDAGWYAAFPQVKDGDAYYLAPAQRVSLW